MRSNRSLLPSFKYQTAYGLVRRLKISRETFLGYLMNQAADFELYLQNFIHVEITATGRANARNPASFILRIAKYSFVSFASIIYQRWIHFMLTWSCTAQIASLHAQWQKNKTDLQLGKTYPRVHPVQGSCGFKIVTGVETPVEELQLVLASHIPFAAFKYTNLRSRPVADPALTQEILDIIQQASHFRQLKKGANEGSYSIYLILFLQGN